MEAVKDFVKGYLGGKEQQKPKPAYDGFSFFLDTSGSVGNSANYWNQVNQLLTIYGQKISNYYFWNSVVEPADKKRFEKAIAQKKGWNGTSPQTVAQRVVQSKITKIILVTDGEVTDNSVKLCDQYLEKHKFEKSICYIVSTGHGELNMSVTCPFTRNCDNQVYSKKKDCPLEKLVQFTPQDYQILDTLEQITLESFYHKYDLIEGLIISLNMGKESNIPLKNQIVKMKNRLVKQLSKEKSKESPDVEIRSYLKQKNIEKALAATKKLVNQYFGDETTTDLQKKIAHLINLCGDLRGMYSIGQIKSNRLAIAKTAEQGKIDKQVEITDLSKNLIECPIIMDEDVPQILIDEGEPILVGVQKNIVEDIANCPLRILNYAQIKQKFKSRLSNYIGVKFGDQFFKNPFTQNKLLGAIPLGTHESHVKVGNHTIAKLMTGGKILGNLNLYFAVIWYLIKEGNIQYLKQIQPNAEEHLIFRLNNSKTMASLCGLAQFVTTEVSSDVAVWYCVNSGYFNQPTDRDTFRYHAFNMEPLIDMVKLLGYPIVKGTEEHLLRTKTMLYFLNKVKKFTPFQYKDYKTWLQCFYQKAITINPENLDKQFIKIEVPVHLVPIDGEPDQAQRDKIVEMMPNICKKMPIEQVYYLAKLADPQKSAANIFIDFNLIVSPLPKFEVNWDYKLTEYEKKPIKICEKTLRPFYMVNNHTWQQEAEQTYKVSPNKLFRGHKYFQAFVFKHNRLPKNADELTIFYYNRYIENGNKKTLPYMMKRWSQDVLQDYEQVWKITPFVAEDVKKIWETSMAIQKRKQIQKMKIEEIKE